MLPVLEGLLQEMGTEPREIERRRYDGLRFEGYIGGFHTTLYYYSRKDEPAGVVYVEARIGAPVSCWSSAPDYSEKLERVRRAVSAVVDARVDYSDELVSIIR